MGNNNVLAGRKCPKCGSEGPFEVTFRVTVRGEVADDGYYLGDMSVVEDELLSDSSPTECTECGYEARMADFDEDNQKELEEIIEEETE